MNGAWAPALTESSHPTKRHLREKGRSGIFWPEEKRNIRILAVLLVFQHRRREDAKKKEGEGA